MASLFTTQMAGLGWGALVALHGEFVTFRGVTTEKVLINRQASGKELQNSIASGLLFDAVIELRRTLTAPEQGESITDSNGTVYRIELVPKDLGHAWSCQCKTLNA